mmetsp:Transcript_53348/g.114638  ORF Transcript_53348/g.114638 Transcript_53348/m.114638 type:complete len:275 (-) Transcript_53348:380-1204(-)
MVQPLQPRHPPAAPAVPGASWAATGQGASRSPAPGMHPTPSTTPTIGGHPASSGARAVHGGGRPRRLTRSGTTSVDGSSRPTMAAAAAPASPPRRQQARSRSAQLSAICLRAEAFENLPSLGQRQQLASSCSFDPNSLGRSPPLLGATAAAAKETEIKISPLASATAAVTPAAALAGSTRVESVAASLTPSFILAALLLRRQKPRLGSRFQGSSSRSASRPATPASPSPRERSSQSAPGCSAPSAGARAWHHAAVAAPGRAAKTPPALASPALW